MQLNNIKKDIIIGTAQLSSQYGIANKNHNHSLSKSINFLNYAKKNNFINFDTAFAYKDAHRVIGKWSKKENYLPNIYTKIPKLNNYTNVKLKIIFHQILKDLNMKNIKGLLLHHSKDWKNDTVKKFINDILYKNIISKFGLSIYEKSEIIEHPNIKIIQTPGNIFNQAIIRSKELQEFCNKGGEVQIRSIFVQGLILMNVNEIPNSLKECKKCVSFFQNISKDLNIPPLILAIACVKRIIPSSKIVIGFDDLKQLKTLKDIHKFSVKEEDIDNILDFGKKNSGPIWDTRNWNL